VLMLMVLALNLGVDLVLSRSRKAARWS
jgi:hypothetical protein